MPKKQKFNRHSRPKIRVEVIPPNKIIRRLGFKDRIEKTSWFGEAFSALSRFRPGDFLSLAGKVKGRK